MFRNGCARRTHYESASEKSSDEEKEEFDKTDTENGNRTVLVELESGIYISLVSPLPIRERANLAVRPTDPWSTADPWSTDPTR